MVRKILEQEVCEVFDGVMLGDGGLYHTGINAQFSLSLSARLDQALCAGMLEYLQHVKTVFGVLGIEFCTGHPTVYHIASKSRCYLRPTLKSKVHSFLQSQYIRWYTTSKVKRVPEDVAITPLSLAYWFVGDGCSSRDNRCVTVNVSLQTHGFQEDDLMILEDRLHGLGLHTGRKRYRGVNTGAGLAVTVLQDSVNKFMDLISPYMVEPYMYKLKYREQRC